MSAVVTIRQTTATTMNTNNNNNNTTTNKNSNDNHNNNNSQTTVRSYGITQPISTKTPDPSDITATKSLEDTLRSYDYFESSEELSHRVQVMAKLNVLVREWIRNVSLSKNVPPEITDSVGGRVHTFGSYRLGVHSKGGDIDTLLIAPRHIDRTDFFTTFAEHLRRQPEVRDLRAIEEAYVPVIKLTFDGIELDMLFARLALPTIPDNLDLKDDKILHNLDHRCARSLNGCRVTDELLDLVPNRETFKSTLRAIKLWAKKNGLYSNALGFFGGVTWSMLVARICQLYPNAVAATLVHKFFRVYSDWEWPTPVLLKPVNDCRYGFPVWDPMTNPSDRYHLMPIITPAYPQQNSTHNVTQSTQKLIVKEIKRGLEIVNDVMTSKSEWKQLFIGTPFFQRYKHYIILLLSASDQNQFLEWSGLVEAKIRILIGNLERNSYIDIAHVSSDKYTPDECVVDQLQQTTKTSTETESVNRTNGNKSPESLSTNSTQQSSPPSNTPTTASTFSGMWVVGLQFKNVNKVQLDLTEEIRLFTNVVYKAAANSNMNRENLNLDARYMRRRDLHTVLPKHAVLTAASSPRLSKAMSLDDKLDSKSSTQLKLPRLNSTSSDSVVIVDSDLEPKIKRQKLEDANESSTKTLEPTLGSL
ncbi:unnamed protein product [Rotaria socialis]|uniref:Poly(A) polymerase n=1 Tax=Rotaria socialis TaxID=392032 RepID=A0A817WHK1_9BILA|nr:unnamed protein product [Rotaria socialis]CAF3355913.1 unnamed protein product [Rotaria socialis]CAF3736709.1 unnamed protein product [Rotaria socialis]CAF3772871.1 unnamed protein product [Rotaria socialis]CAF4128324.1 unnamed protein product [Rotaria socialis]